MATLYVTHPRYTEHDLPGHPEHAGRIEAVWKRLDADGLTARMRKVEASMIDRALLETVHTPAYLDLLERTSGQDRLFRLDADTYICPTSYEVARLSAGGTVDAVTAVITGTANNAIAIVRPPGHHAMPDRGMGFCLLSNIAIATRYAEQVHGLRRILIVDYDVHHGNGTEAALYDDGGSLFISTHQWPLYPGTGTLSDIGEGAGRGLNVNIPMPGGQGDGNYAAVFEQIIWPLAQRYAPELILVSVGHDAHWRDPLASMRLSLKGYAHLARELTLMAQQLCEGKIVFLMEGGYDLDALSYGWSNIARVLLGDDRIQDPLGPSGDAEPNIERLIERVQQIHGLT